MADDDIFRSRSRLPRNTPTARPQPKTPTKSSRKPSSTPSSARKPPSTPPSTRALPINPRTPPTHSRPAALIVPSVLPSTTKRSYITITNEDEEAYQDEASLAPPPSIRRRTVPVTPKDLSRALAGRPSARSVRFEDRTDNDQDKEHVPGTTRATRSGRKATNGKGKFAQETPSNMLRKLSTLLAPGANQVSEPQATPHRPLPISRRPPTARRTPGRPPAAATAAQSARKRTPAATGVGPSVAELMMSQQKKGEVVAAGRVTKKNASKTPSDLLRKLSRMPGFKPKTPVIQERPQEEAKSLTPAPSAAKQAPATSASRSARAAVSAIPNPDEDEIGESSHAGGMDGAATATDDHVETYTTYNASISDSDEGDIEEQPWDEPVEQGFEDDYAPEEGDEEGDEDVEMEMEMEEREDVIEEEDEGQNEEESEFHDARYVLPDYMEEDSDDRELTPGGSPEVVGNLIARDDEGSRLGFSIMEERVGKIARKESIRRTENPFVREAPRELRAKKVVRLSQTGVPVPSLPNSLIKQMFTTFSKTKVSREAMETVYEASHMFFEQAAGDLAAYAAHAKRKMIKESDVQCLMQRQRLVTDKSTIESLAQRYLPRELTDLVCVSALAGNVLSVGQAERPRRKREASWESEVEVEMEGTVEQEAEAEEGGA